MAVTMGRKTALEAVRELCALAFEVFKGQHAVDAPCIGLVSIDYAHKNHSAKHANVIDVPIRRRKQLASRSSQRTTHITLYPTFAICRTYANR